MEHFFTSPPQLKVKRVWGRRQKSPRRPNLCGWAFGSAPPRHQTRHPRGWNLGYIKPFRPRNGEVKMRLSKMRAASGGRFTACTKLWVQVKTETLGAQMYINTQARMLGVSWAFSVFANVLENEYVVSWQHLKMIQKQRGTSMVKEWGVKEESHDVQGLGKKLSD